MRLCVLAALLAAVPSVAQEGLRSEQWTQGRLLLTVGGTSRGLFSSDGDRQVMVSEPTLFLQAGPTFAKAGFSGAWFFRSWLGVGADVRLDPFSFSLRNDTATRTNRFVVSGTLVGLARWQVTPLLGLEGQVGWSGAQRPYIERGMTGSAPSFATTGPLGGIALNLDLTRQVWLQLYGRVEYVGGLTEVRPSNDRLQGFGLTGGLQARFGSISLGPVELGVGLLAEVVHTDLSEPRPSPADTAPQTRFQGTMLRVGLGGSVTVRRPAPAGPVPTKVLRGLRGLVLKTDRTPVTGASVSVGDRSVVSDASGAFEVTDLSSGPVEVKAQAPGLRPATVSVMVAEGLTETELVLETPTGPGRVTGIVRAGPDKPLAGAKVVSGTKTATTQASGAYTLEGVGPGPVQVRVMLDGYVPADEAVQVPPEATATLDVTLEQAAQRTKAKLRGVISSAAGPVAKATVRVVELKVKQTVKADGRFEVEVPGGKYTLVIEAPKHVTQTKQVEVADGDQAIFQIELEKLR